MAGFFWVLGIAALLCLVVIIIALADIADRLRDLVTAVRGLGK